jgi:hypothetical protein
MTNDECGMTNDKNEKWGMRNDEGGMERMRKGE